MLVATYASVLDEPHVLPVGTIPPGALKPKTPTVGGRTLREATPVASMRHLRDLQAGNTSVHLPVLLIRPAERDVPPRNPRRLVPGSEERRQHQIGHLQLPRRELAPRTHPPEQRLRRLRRTTFRLRLAHFRRESKDKQPKRPSQAPPGATPHLQSCTKSRTLARPSGKNFQKRPYFRLSPVQPISPSIRPPKCPQIA